MYESRHHPLLPTSHFVKRLVMHASISLALLLGSLWLGMLGYQHFEGLAWRDAFLNSAMLLGGMGPVDPPHSDGGKIFAGCYALYAGLVFLIAVSLIIVPVLHRILHSFHLEENA